MTKPNQLLSLASLAVALSISGGLRAEPSMPLVLSGSAEVPPVSTRATGSGEITVQPDRSISGKIVVAGMAPTMAHIHEAAAGTNGPPIITLSPGADGQYSVPPGSRLSEEQFASHSAGKLYVNVHSSLHPGGEIRAQLPGNPLRMAY